MRSPDPSEDSPRSSTRNRLGKYRLVATLGRGGMADVYLGVVEGPGGFSKLLVVKELRQESREDDVGMRMFLDEARVAARLNHPNIVQTLEVSTDGSRCFLAMEYLEGQPLRRVVRRAHARKTSIPLHTHLQVLADVLGALHYAHSFTGFDGAPLALVHRDVSPQNVILTYEGHVKLIDFGIAKTALASVETREGIVKGKVKYMPPEQATGQAVDARTDVFAVGVMVWEAIVGHGPWHDQTDVAIFRALMSGAIPRIRDQNAGLDADLIAIVDRAVSADPRDRYPTAAAMRDDLESAIALRKPPSSMRDLPVLLSTLFESDRRELRALIENQIQSPDSPDPDVLSLPTSMTRVRTGASEPTRTPTVSRLATLPKTYVSPIPPPPAAVSRPKTLVLTCIAAVTVVIATTLVRTWWPAAHIAALAAPEPPSTASSAPTAPSTAEVAPSSHVEMRASPPSARLYVDDASVSNPYAADLPRDGSIHHLRAEAPGYTTKTRPFVAGTDGSLDLALEPVPWRPTISPRAAVDAAVRALPPTTVNPPSAPSEPSNRVNAPPASRRPKREVDKEDPYAP